jgi:hypothetical protein
MASTGGEPTNQEAAERDAAVSGTGAANPAPQDGGARYSGRKGNISYFPFEPNSWAELPLDKAAETIFNYAIGHTDEAVRWYTIAKRTKSRVSSLFRGIAIFFGILGGLAPVIAAMAPSTAEAGEPSLQLLVTQAGYLAVGIAAGAIAFDRYYGYSSGWLRYMTAMTNIERLRLEFILDWAKLRREAPALEKAVILKLLERATAFRKALQQVIEDETNAWATEFQASIGGLDKFIQDTRQKAETTLQEMERQRTAQRAAPQTGSLNLDLAADWEGEVEVTVENEPTKLVSGRKIGFSNLKPSTRSVTVAGIKKGKKVEESNAMTIEAGKIATLTL